MSFINANFIKLFEISTNNFSKLREKDLTDYFSLACLERPQAN